MPELPLILIVEDEYLLQGVVEETLTDGGFATDILSSGEEALTLFKGGLKNYKALVTDVSLKGRMAAGKSRDRSGKSTRLSRSFTFPVPPGISGHRKACPTASLSKSRSR